MEDSAVKVQVGKAIFEIRENCHQKVGGGYIYAVTCLIRDPKVPVICPCQFASRLWRPCKMSTKLTINQRRLTTHLTRHAGVK